MRHHLEERLFAYLLFDEPQPMFEPEVSMPRKSRRIDGLLRLEEPGESWGCLRQLVAHRLCVVEAFSRPPSRGGVASAFTKLAWVNEAWCTARLAHGRRPPCLVIFTDGTPRRALDAWSISATTVLGIRLNTDQFIRDVLLVDIRRLPRVDGTSVLRWLAPPRTPAEAADRLAHLREDRHLSDTFVRRLEEAIVSKSIPATPYERQLTYQGAIELGRKEGLQEGRREGRREGRNEGLLEGRRLALLNLARDLCTEDELDALEAMTDLEVLQRQVALLVTRSRQT